MGCESFFSVNLRAHWHASDSCCHLSDAEHYCS